MLLDHFRHEELAPFVIRYFLHRTSWVTGLHHIMGVAMLVAMIAEAAVGPWSWWMCLLQFLGAFAILLLIILPLHEALHAAAYLLCGARQIEWHVIWRLLAAYVLAHRFVANRAVFLFVALTPFVIINALLIVGAVSLPDFRFFLLALLFWHTAGSSGDWSLLNYYWLHRRHELFTFDESGVSYFYARASAQAECDAMHRSGVQ